MSYIDSFVEVKWNEKERALPLYSRFISSLNQSRHLIVYTHGAVSSDRFPYYNGMNIGSELSSSANFLLFSDPLLSLFETKKKCSWFTSPFEEENIIESMANVIKDVVNKFNIEKILFIGGSAGAIPLIRVSQYFTEACFFMWNPQLHIFNYHSGHVERYCKALSIGPELKNALKQADYLSSCNMFDKKWFENKENKYYIVQMFNDDFHIKNHIEPFCASIRGKKSIISSKFSKNILPNVLVHIGRWSFPYRRPDGSITNHLPPSKRLQERLIKDFVSSGDIFSSNYFRKWNVK